MFEMFELGPKKYQKLARMYDRTGLSTKCTLMKTGFKNLRTGTKANFRPFVDALLLSQVSLIQDFAKIQSNIGLIFECPGVKVTQGGCSSANSQVI